MRNKLALIACAIVVVVVAAGGGATAAALITSKQIKDGTIQVHDLNSKTVKALKGKPGPRGPAGQSGTFKKTQTVIAAWSVGDHSKSAMCPAGTTVVGGGIRNERSRNAVGSNPWDYTVLQTYPINNGWFVEIYKAPNSAGTSGTAVWTYAVCAS